MSNIKTINLTFDLGQVANDILTKCNLISQTIKEEAMEDIRANVQEPDSPETRSIINRAVTEAFGHVKKACQRYLKVGRTSDNNNLERIVASGSSASSITYEKVTLQLEIPNFNVAVTDALKSDIHLYVVDYTMGRFLQDQVTDKASEYAALANERDYPNIRRDLNARERFNMRKPSWI